MANPPEDIPGFFSQHTSSLNGSGFLPHRPMSSGIDSITQGFRFAAPGKKPSANVWVERGVVGVQDKSPAIASNEVIGSEPNSNEMSALKVSVPIFPNVHASASAPPLPLPPVSAAAILAMADEQIMLQPTPFPHLSDRRRGEGIAKEKRKRIDSSGSLTADTEGRIQSSDGVLLSQAGNGERGRFEAPGSIDVATGNGDRRVGPSRSGAPGDERRPKKKRPDRLEGHSRPTTTPLSTAPVEAGGEAEIIVLDDDVKIELVDVKDSMTVSGEGVPNNSLDVEVGVPVKNPESLQRRGNFRVHTDQPMKQNALQPKDSNLRIETRFNPPNERAGTLNLHPGVEAGRANGQLTGSNRSSVYSNCVNRKRRSENDGHVMGPQPQQPSFRPTRPSLITPMLEEEREQSSTGEHKLLVALTTLTTEKQTLEKKFHEAMVLLKTQAFRAETSERKNAELEAQVQTSRDNVAGLKKMMMGFQKFLDGLGKDYNMLNEKNLQLKTKLSEVSRDRDELLRSLQDVRYLAEKANGTVQGWGSSEAILKDAHQEIKKLNETLKFLHSQLSENAGLLAMERDRTQSLECQIENDRKNNKDILAAIQDGKSELAGKLTELKEAFGTNTELDLRGSLAEIQKAIEVKVEVDGEKTRSLIGNCLKAVEKLRDREVDAAECFIGVEQRINHTSDSIMGLFQETYKMNAEALSVTDGYINHLVSRTKDLETELKDMREKYEISLVVSAEKKQVEKDLEQQLKVIKEKCNEMSSQVERGKMTENELNESISMLQQKNHILETRSTEGTNSVEAMRKFEQKNYELERECELLRNEAREANSSLQSKGSELESLRTGLETLVVKYRESEERVERFEKEKAEFMALAEEQKMKERIEFETNANMFRQRETSRLNNQIKALEAQKERLETDNRGFRSAAAETSDIVLGLKREITKLQKKNTAFEKSHLELIQEKMRLESLVSHSVQEEATARLGYSALEKRTEEAAKELSKALEQIDILRGDKKLISEEIDMKQQELERVNSENFVLRVAAEDITVLQTVERQLREALEEAQAEKRIAKREKEDAVSAQEALGKRTKVLEEKFEELKYTNRTLEDRSSNTMVDLDKGLEVLMEDDQKLRETEEETISELDRISKLIPPGEQAAVILAEASAISWNDGSPPLSPFTPVECIFETQMNESGADNTLRPEHERWSDFSMIDNTNFERYLFGDDEMVDIRDLAKDVLEGPSKVEDQVEELLPNAPPTASLIKGVKKNSQILQPRKNMATKFASHRKAPSMELDNIDDQVAAIESLSGDAESKVIGANASLPRNTYLEQPNTMPHTLKSRSVEEKDSKSRKKAGNFESTLVERYSFAPATPSNKPNTPQRNDSILHRPRKERGRKNRDDQEWTGEGAELQRNNKGKEETPNMKKSLRSYKERKKSGKKFM